MRININRKNLLDIINLKFGVFDPIDKFMSKESIISVIEDFSLRNNVFFPLPIYFDVDDGSVADMGATGRPTSASTRLEGAQVVFAGGADERGSQHHTSAVDDVDVQSAKFGLARLVETQIIHSFSRWAAGRYEPAR